MNDKQASDFTLPDPVALSQSMVKIAEKSQFIVSKFLSRQVGQSPPPFDPMTMSKTFMEITGKLMENPEKIVQTQIDLWGDYLNLWQQTTHRLLGQETQDIIAPKKGDRRFKHATWSENFVFNYIKQSYLLTTRSVQSMVHTLEGKLDEKKLLKLDFYTRQFLDALAPSNFVLTNPEVLRETIESSGENLVKGLDNILKDLERNKEHFRISMTDYDSFNIGDNIAVTPGKVIYQNELMQLIQYTPTTETVYQRPLLIIPPWINKYYIMDLQPKNSLIKWIVDQGITVFLISWVNPDEQLSHKSFEDYLLEGPITALEIIKKQVGKEDINALGYCLGGTLLAITLAYLAQKKQSHRIQSATFFTTMLDFSHPGELGIFIDEEMLTSIETMMSEKGYLEGAQMAIVFNLLRANDLIWSFVINNYLLGKDPFPFDLLYWNSDSTRLPAQMHAWYLRNMYQRNLLVEPGALSLGGVPMDLTAIKTPAFFLSTQEDHIAPWESTYMGMKQLQGPNTFILAASGHIAGVINPPGAKKYWYWYNDKLPQNASEWLQTATQEKGSWWPYWIQWYDQFGEEQVPERDPSGGPFQTLEDAPGSYVKVVL